MDTCKERGEKKNQQLYFHFCKKKRKKKSKTKKMKICERNYFLGGNFY